MQDFEQNYAEMLEEILKYGEVRQTRNGETKSMFANTLKVPVYSTFPLVQGRKIYYKGVFGELAAMLRKPQHISHFERWGCNYWKQWARKDGHISIDYGNAWHANGQITKLKHMLANDPTNRRMIISGWRPERIEDLDLPCCHLLYQFYVSQNRFLDMIWYQRSVDMMIGLPSDIILAAAWLIAIADDYGFTPGTVTMNLGDCHIYAEHYEQTRHYISNVFCKNFNSVKYEYAGTGDFCEFDPAHLTITRYEHCPPIKLELKI